MHRRPKALALSMTAVFGIGVCTIKPASSFSQTVPLIIIPWTSRPHKIARDSGFTCLQSWPPRVARTRREAQVLTRAYTRLPPTSCGFVRYGPPPGVFSELSESPVAVSVVGLPASALSA